ncbi:MAG TPA: M56 family metallopeptidase [Candidatus Agrococcus pullicola]|uniref:M56 family metallopeptidase n=1 Tax=Candidatus Agrococcus pullicola TaxID=2838429 RepID=A0A9D2C9V6_9MICO|nr:M56 family metallopeptidase [Candidatus Agrococcus pullicola]
MSAAVLTLLASVLLLAAIWGPELLRRAAPALATTPQVAVIALTAGAVAWMAALFALGPVIAWMSTGPAWLPQRAADVCSQCLSAATPFGDSAVSLGIPAILPLAFPALGAVIVSAGIAREFTLLRATWRSPEAQLRNRAPEVLFGHVVRVIPDEAQFAYALPRRRGGIVVSSGACDRLSHDELCAVLAHEREHVRKHHHIVLTLLFGLTRYCRWVPLIAAIRDAVPLYLEIAADRAAKRTVGTSSLASALLKLGDSSRAPRSNSAVLHASAIGAGSERVRQLIGRPPPKNSAVIAAAAVAYALTLAVAIAGIHWPYLAALLNGCLM